MRFVRLLFGFSFNPIIPKIDDRIAYIRKKYQIKSVFEPSINAQNEEILLSFSKEQKAGSYIQDFFMIAKFIQDRTIAAEIYRKEANLPYAEYMYLVRSYVLGNNKIETQLLSKIKNLSKHNFYKLFITFDIVNDSEKELLLKHFYFVESAKLDMFLEEFRNKLNLIRKDNVDITKLDEIIGQLSHEQINLPKIEVTVEEFKLSDRPNTNNKLER